MNRSLLFIGAGASYGARENCHSPPLGEDLLKFLIKKTDWFLANPELTQHCHTTIIKRDDLERLKGLFERAKCIGSYEQAMNYFSKNPPENFEQALINRFISFAFSATPEFGNRIDLYDELIQKLNIDSTWSILSLNYDILFEQALLRKRIPYCYSQLEQERDGVEILKPHGSINFFQTSPDYFSLDDQIKKMMETDEETRKVSIETGITIIRSSIPQRLTFDRKMTIMANYDDSKSTWNNLGALNKIRARCEKITDEIERVIIIGVAIPEHNDTFVKSLFDKFRKIEQITFVNKGSEDCKKASKIFGSDQVEQKTLESWLN